MGAVIIHLRPPLLAAFRWALRPSRATYPEARAGSPQLLPQTPAGVLLVLLQVGFAVPVCCQTRGALLPHHFTLTGLPKKT